MVLPPGSCQMPTVAVLRAGRPFFASGLAAGFFGLVTRALPRPSFFPLEVFDDFVFVVRFMAVPPGVLRTSCGIRRPCARKFAPGGGVMDWSNERYVRVYTRDTVNWKLWSWHARALWLLLMRKLDRAGVLDIGRHGVRGVAAAVEMPLEVVEPALAEILRDGTIEVRGDGSEAALVAPRFMDAQDANQTDAQRKRESRARRRDEALLSQLPETRQPCLPGVTKPDETVTIGHSDPLPIRTSPDPSPPHADPLPRRPDRTEGGGGVGSTSSDLEQVTREVVGQFYGPLERASPPERWQALIAELLAEGYRREELIAIAWCASTGWADDDERRGKAELDWALKPKARRARGGRTPDEWLAAAETAWREESPGKLPPWRAPPGKPKNGISAAGAAP